MPVITSRLSSLSPPSLLFHKMVLLVTSDNEQFHADKEVVERSVLIKNMLEGRPAFSAKTTMSEPVHYRCW